MGTPITWPFTIIPRPPLPRPPIRPPIRSRSKAGWGPTRPQKLYYTAIPRRFFRTVVAKMQELGLEVPERYLDRLEAHWPAR